MTVREKVDGSTCGNNAENHNGQSFTYRLITPTRYMRKPRQSLSYLPNVFKFMNTAHLPSSKWRFLNDYPIIRRNIKEARKKAESKEVDYTAEGIKVLLNPGILEGIPSDIFTETVEAIDPKLLKIFDESAKDHVYGKNDFNINEVESILNEKRLTDPIIKLENHSNYAQKAVDEILNGGIREENRLIETILNDEEASLKEIFDNICQSYEDFFGEEGYIRDDLFRAFFGSVFKMTTDVAVKNELDEALECFEKILNVRDMKSPELHRRKFPKFVTTRDHKRRSYGAWNIPCRFWRSATRKSKERKIKEEKMKAAREFHAAEIDEISNLEIIKDLKSAFPKLFEKETVSEKDAEDMLAQYFPDYQETDVLLEKHQNLLLSLLEETNQVLSKYET